MPKIKMRHYELFSNNVLLWRWKMIEILLIFFVVRWVLLTRILTRVKLSWPSTSSEWFSLTFNVYVRLCCDDSNPQDFFLSLQKSSGHIYLSQSVLILHVRTLGQNSIFGAKIKWKVEFPDILLSKSIVFCAKIHKNVKFFVKVTILDKKLTFGLVWACDLKI